MLSTGLHYTGSALRAVKRRWRRARARSIAGKSTEPHRLHVGCGGVRFPGWLHLDAAYWNGNYDPTVILWNIQDGLPLPDQSCQLIYSEHLVEHLTVPVAELYFRECFRVLAPGGVVRTAMPDLHDCVNHYHDNCWRQQPWLQEYGYQHIRTGAEYLNTCLRDWGHLWLYDQEELQRRLSDAGFTQVRSCDYGQSTIAELAGRETRPESQLICEAVR